ncbi:MAG: hypothetical protein Pg6B_10990 [Candidatus Azobacteroides pseudotrichonymphae]|nr:MAG: hypothetical protein Pg6B_10990 [Candidatus Azobacteroides pseudotrichonymphae]
MKKLLTLALFSIICIGKCSAFSILWIDREPYKYNNIIHSIVVPYGGEQAEQRKMMSVSYGEVYRGEQYRYSGNWYTKGSEGDIKPSDDTMVEVLRTEYINKL